MICPNKNLKEWKDLELAVGENKAYYLWVKHDGKVPVEEFTDQAQEINESEITYTDENGNPCAVKGLTNTTKGTNWKIVKDFKGMPKHSQGGVDITISDKGVNIRRGGKDIKAAHGLLIAATGLVIPPDPKNKPKTDPIKDNDDKIYESGVTLKEVVTTAEAPEWLKYREEYVKNNPFNIDEYVENRYNTPIGREAIKKIDGESWKKELKQEGFERRYNAAMDYTGEALVRNKPQGELSRAEWLNQMSDEEEEIIKRNPKYQSSLWVDAKRGLTSLVGEDHTVQAFSNILNSPDFSNREKREMLKDYAEHPVMSKLGDAAKILSPLTVGSKVVQSFYRDDTTLEDALQGKKNKAGMLEDIVTDPLNLIGLGIWGKLSQTGKFAKIGDVYKAVSNLPGAEKLAAIQKFLGTEEGLLSNMYKYNSFANKEVPMNKLFHGSNNPNLSLDDIKFTEVNPNVGLRPGQFKRRAIKSGDPLEMPGGFYTNDRSVPKFMGNAPYRYSMEIPANSKVFKWESGVSDNISVKKLQELKNKGYDVIQGKNILGETEYIPLNKDLINNWKRYQKEAPELELLKDSNFETITPNWLKGYPKVPKKL